MREPGKIPSTSLGALSGERRLCAARLGRIETARCSSGYIARLCRVRLRWVRAAREPCRAPAGSTEKVEITFRCGGVPPPSTRAAGRGRFPKPSYRRAASGVNPRSVDEQPVACARARSREIFQLCPSKSARTRPGSRAAAPKRTTRHSGDVALEQRGRSISTQARSAKAPFA